MTEAIFKKSSLIIAVLLIALLFPATAFAQTVIMTGDADFDGKISSADARLALRRSVGLEKKMSENGVIACDTDFDGSVTAADARMILRVSVNLDKFSQLYISIRDEQEIEGNGVTDPSVGFFEEPDTIIENFFEAQPPAAPEIKNPQPDSFTFIVYGYGHGVGMSQYGAVLLSQQKGFTYGDIIGYYYTRTQIVSEKAPETSFYPSDNGITEVSTEQLVARIVQMEIGGITNDEQALKAIAVAVYTNLKRLDYRVNIKYTVGYAVSSYESCSTAVKKAAHDVLGQYITVAGDSEKKPIEAVYSALCAGHSASSESVWGGSLSYLQPVNCCFEMQISSFISTATISSAELREKILAYDETTVLSENPAEWLEILSHSVSVDENRGYVNKIRVGDKTLTGYGEFYCSILGGTQFMRSHCFTVQYTPPAAK